jgi:hypothetical protein
MEISDNICKIWEHKDMIHYKSICACTADEHTQTICLEYDKSFNGIILYLYQTFRIKEYWKGPWYKNWIRRVKYSLQIIFKGTIELESDFLFRNEEHIQDYINALSEGIEKIKSNIGKTEEITIR